MRFDMLTPNTLVTVRFGDAKSGHGELAVFRACEGKGDDARALFTSPVEATSTSETFDWEAYKYQGRWSYGTGADRLSLLDTHPVPADADPVQAMFARMAADSTRNAAITEGVERRSVATNALRAKEAEVTELVRAKKSAAELVGFLARTDRTSALQQAQDLLTYLEDELSTSQEALEELQQAAADAEANLAHVTMQEVS